MDHLIVSIHQPNYLPWLGYFFKIYASDIFILLDDVSYSSSSLTKRCFIRKQKASTEKTYLRVPLQAYSYPVLLPDLRIDHQQAWQVRQRNQLQAVYRRAPYFEQYFPIIEALWEESRTIPDLVSFNERVILEMMKLLSITTPVLKSSDVAVSGKKAAYVLALVKYCKANCYLSGTGAKRYQDEDSFHEAGITIVYNELFDYLKAHPYPQAQGPFLNGLSLLDALFNIGAEGILSLFNNYQSQLDFSPLER